MAEALGLAEAPLSTTGSFAETVTLEAEDVTETPVTTMGSDA